MASFVQRALMYLGLKDIDDDEIYDGDDDEVTEAPSRVRQSAYPEPAPPRATVATVRPIARDDARELQIPAARSAVVRPLVTQRHSKPQVVAPARFSDAQEIGDMVKANSPVIVNLQASEKDLARRMIDFCSGLTYAVGGSMEKVAESVFLLTPSNFELPQKSASASKRTGSSGPERPRTHATSWADREGRRRLSVIIDILNVFLFVLVVRVVLSYIPAPPGSALVPITRFFEAVTEPVLRPIRHFVPPLRVGGAAVDLSPIIVWIVILIVRGLL